jgi:mannose-1-phosphate guanylyltransferase/mannose-6-phosphate isomerase
MPSDQAIPDAARFADAVLAAADVARTGRHVLFAITPDSPHTGYGYIRRGRPLAGATGVFEVDEFLEKPLLEKATAYVADGGYAWNSGIFVLHAATFVADLDALSPDIVAAARASVTAATHDLGFVRLDPEAFARSPGISVDYAVMEKTKLAAVMPLDIAWSDVGSWSSLWNISPKDDCGNAGDGRAILTDSTGCLIRSARPVVATIGVHDLVIVDTPDALLVADRGRAQEVGKLAALLKSQQRRESEQHIVSHRPWGHFETLSLGDRFQVKRLHVKPGAKLSLQMHHHRSEHWVVVQGTAKVTVGETEQLLRENESVYIVATQWHRLENPGKVPLELIEVQIGTYLGEDDIIRSDDVYNRAPSETK